MDWDAHTGGQLECPYRLITGLVRPSSNSLLTIVCDSTEQHKTIFWLPVQQLMQRTLTGCPHCIHSTCALRLLSKLTMTVKGNNYLRHVVCFWCRAVTQRFENSAQIVRNWKRINRRISRHNVNKHRVVERSGPSPTYRAAQTEYFVRRMRSEYIETRLTREPRCRCKPETIQTAYKNETHKNGAFAKLQNKIPSCSQNY